ncbi:hypothetical protein ACX1DX_04355 [Tessaracoccus sp. Y36]
MTDHNKGDEVRFDSPQLHARIDGPLAADPWGALDEDEYAVPGEVTGAETDKNREDRRRRKAAAMALRGSGTRGRKGGGAGAMPPAMMPPNATVGGVGAAPGGAGAMQPMMSAGPGAAGGGIPTMLQGAQAGRLAGPSLFGPSGSGASGAMFGPGGFTAPGGGLMAAGTEDSLDAEQLREALRRSGLDQLVAVDSDGRIIEDPLVDTDGDGVPDTPLSKVRQRDGRNTAPTAGVQATGLQSVYQQGPGSGSYAAGAMAPGTTAPGTTAPGTTVPGTTVPGTTLPGSSGPGGTQSPSTGYYPGGPVAAGDASGSETDPSTNSPGSQSGGGFEYDGGHQTGVRPQDGTTNSSTSPTYTSTGSQTGTRPSGSTSFAQPTSTYSSTGGSDYSVNTDQLRRESTNWSDLADRSKPMQDTIMSTPEPGAMFGVMTEAVPPYRTAVESSVQAASDAGLEAEAQAMALDAASNNYDQNETQATDSLGGMNS